MNPQEVVVGDDALPTYVGILDDVSDPLWDMLGLGERPTLVVRDRSVKFFNQNHDAIKKVTKVTAGLLRILFRYAPKTLSKALHNLHKKMNLFEEGKYILRINGVMVSLARVEAYLLLIISMIRSEKKPWDTAGRQAKRYKARNNAIQIRAMEIARRAYTRFSNMDGVEDTYQHIVSNPLSPETTTELHEAMYVFITGLLNMVGEIKTHTISEMDKCPRCYTEREGKLFIVNITNIDANNVTRHFAICKVCAESVCRVTRVCEARKLIDRHQAKRRRNTELGPQNDLERDIPSEKRHKSGRKPTHAAQLHDQELYLDWLIINIRLAKKKHPELFE